MTRIHVRAKLKTRADRICQRYGFAGMLVCCNIAYYGVDCFRDV